MNLGQTLTTTVIMAAPKAYSRIFSKLLRMLPMC